MSSFFAKLKLNLIFIWFRERYETKIYRQFIEQKIDVKIDDSTEDIINEGVIKKDKSTKTKKESKLDIEIKKEILLQNKEDNIKKQATRKISPWAYAY